MPDLANHHRAVVPEAEVELACLTRMHCKLVWISFEEIERTMGCEDGCVSFLVVFCTCDLTDGLFHTSLILEKPW